ncbi:MAG: phosphoenolpyruvate carboxykinase (ATP) [archaeon]|nr:MAG: phosphoenolpyruvate carboxykinase (ATP) [archaeon]
MKFRKTVLNPGHEFYKKLLKPYYVRTKDGQYLFGSTQPGRRPDRAFYMVPEDYRLGKGQKSFDPVIGEKIYEVVEDYLKDCSVIVMNGIQGEGGYKTGLKIATSIENPHSAYIDWMGKLMIFPPDKKVKPSCFNYIVQERLPAEYVDRIRDFWPGFNPDEPMTLYDLTEMENDVRRVVSLGVDYFGGAFKKPNLTMVWNRAESESMISYHAGCTRNRILKGLSGTGKTTLTLGPELEQDDAVVGKLSYQGGKVESVKLIGLEAASFAKSEGLNPESPEWPGLMASREGDVVLCLNIDCENVNYINREINGYVVKVPEVIGDKKPGSLRCKSYEKSGTTNGRFVFHFDVLNRDWGKHSKYMKTESLSFRRFDIMEPIFRVTEPKMAVALDSACESVITSAVSGRRPGERVRSYAATDFMAREQSEQALLKWKVYRDLGLEDNLVFFINNSGYVGECDPGGEIVEGRGEKIRVKDSKRLINLVENRKIRKWIRHPVFSYLIPDPRELEEKGMKNFSQRFNPMNYYTPKEFLQFCRREAKERTDFMKELFKGQKGEKKLKPVTELWQNFKLPPERAIKEFYGEHY